MDAVRISGMFKALGDPTRLRIFQFLGTCCAPVAVGSEGEVRRADGPTVGEVCCHVTGDLKVTSTISFHLKELRNAGLIRMERRGKNMLCAIDREALSSLTTALTAVADRSGCCPSPGEAESVEAR
jgi:ArsR family transcriptional regulator, arsenate/arsenite/antimonite-responsive transcriptional repressor